MDFRDGKIISTVRSRSYAAWFLYLGICALGVYFRRDLWYVFAAVLVLLTFTFFKVRNVAVLTVYEDGLVFHDSDDIAVRNEDLMSFSYTNNEPTSLTIRYRDNGQEKSRTMSLFNASAVHQELNRRFPDRNKVKNEYEKQVQENREANKAYFSRIRNKLSSVFKK